MSCLRLLLHHAGFSWLVHESPGRPGLFGGFHSHGGTQKNSWVVYLMENLENPMKMENWGYPHFRKPPFICFTMFNLCPWSTSPNKYFVW